MNILIHPANVDQSLKKQIVTYKVEDLAAGADIADIPVFRLPSAAKIVEVGIIPQAASAGIDDANTSVWLVEVGSTTIANKTFNTSNTFPTAGTYEKLGDVSNGDRVEGDIVTVSVTNGTNADTPACILQIEYIIKDEALFDTQHVV